MVLGDMFSSLLQGVPGLPPLLVSRSGIIVFITATVLFPLCCLRSFGQLARFSALGTLASSFVVLSVVKRYFDGSYAPLGAFHVRSALPALDDSGMGFDARILVLVSILSTAFLMHFNAPQMYTELSPRGPPGGPADEAEKAAKESRFRAVALVGFGIAAVQYALVMCFGFLTFGRATQGNLLNNYSAADPWAVAARVAVGISTLFGYPMQFAGLRSGLLGPLCPSLPPVQHRLFTAGLLSVVACIA